MTIPPEAVILLSPSPQECSGGRGSKPWVSRLPTARARGIIATMSHPPFHDPDLFPRLQIRLYLTPEIWIGPGKADLLELIGETGSISEAGRRMGMSYKRAWSLVEALNNSFAAPLVERVRGGAGGGGARLTEAGQEVLLRFRRIVAEAGAVSSQDSAALMSLRVRSPQAGPKPGDSRG